MMISLIKSILISPKKGWENLNKINPISLSIGLNLVVNLALIAGLLSFMGIIFSKDGSFVLAIKYFGYVSLKWLLSIFIASWAIGKLTKGFKGETTFLHMLLVIAISSSFLVIAISLTHIFPAAKMILNFLSSVGLIYYYYAILHLTGITHERIPGFLLISLLVYAIIVFFIEMMLVVFFNMPIHL
jgi:hypothetical protein